MRRLMLTLMLAFAALATPALAQLPAADVSAADRTEIRGVIESQMAAFRRDDGALARLHAGLFAGPADARVQQSHRRRNRHLHRQHQRQLLLTTLDRGALFRQLVTHLQP